MIKIKSYISWLIHKTTLVWFPSGLPT
jgi:hypothetical protein